MTSYFAANQKCSENKTDLAHFLGTGNEFRWRPFVQNFRCCNVSSSDIHRQWRKCDIVLLRTSTEIYKCCNVHSRFCLCAILRFLVTSSYIIFDLSLYFVCTPFCMLEGAKPILNFAIDH